MLLLNINHRAVVRTGSKEPTEIEQQVPGTRPEKGQILQIPLKIAYLSRRNARLYQTYSLYILTIVSYAHALSKPKEVL